MRTKHLMKERENNFKKSILWNAKYHKIWKIAIEFWKLSYQRRENALFFLSPLSLRVILFGNNPNYFSKTRRWRRQSEEECGDPLSNENGNFPKRPACEFLLESDFLSTLIDKMDDIESHVRSYQLEQRSIAFANSRIERMISASCFTQTE